MARRVRQLALIAVLAVVGLTIRNLLWEPPRIPPAAQPRVGLTCFRQGGESSYCRCLDRLDSARAAAGRPAPAMPPLDDPVIRFALRHPQRYPIINADTLRCVARPEPPGPGVYIHA